MRTLQGGFAARISRNAGKGEFFPDPVEIFNKSAAGDFVFACEHAGNLIPAPLHGLGLSAADLSDHIAWDIGAAQLTRMLATRFDAPAVLQRYSRLLCDCNRAQGAAGSILAESDGRVIPANAKLDEAAQKARHESICAPFHAAISDILDRKGGRATFITIHSFTPVLDGKRRMLDVGVLHEPGNPFAEALARALPARADVICRENEPYSPGEGVTYTLDMHGGARGLKNVMIEVRNDLIANREGRTRWADILEQGLREAASARTQ